MLGPQSSNEFRAVLLQNKTGGNQLESSRPVRAESKPGDQAQFALL